MFYEISITDILSICTIAITICMGLLVYNNLAYTKKVAAEKATEIAQNALRTVYKNVQQFKDNNSQSFAMDLYTMAKAEKDRQLQLILLNEAEIECTENDAELKDKILRLKKILGRFKDDEDFFDIV